MTTLKDLDNTASAIKTKTEELKQQYNRIYGGHLRYEHIHIGGQGDIEIPEFHFQPAELSQMIFDIIMDISVECDCGRNVGRILENCISEQDIRKAILKWIKEH